MRVRVRLFAALAERAGWRDRTVELDEGATPEDAWAALPPPVRDGGLGPPAVRVAVNLQYAEWSQVLRDGDEVAFIPPVAGGNGHGAVRLEDPPVTVCLTAGPLSPEAAVAALSDPAVGAVAVFVGTVRRVTGARRTQSILYEAYGPMAEQEMHRIGQEVRDRWPQARIVLAHRVGRLSPQDISLVIAVATPHRGDAFEALRYATEQLKHRVPIWKKERYDDGEEWVGMGA